MKLLVRPKPETGESFIGYLVRLTEVNGYDTPSWILSLADINYMELQWKFSFVFGKFRSLAKFADLTDNAVSDLNALIYHPSNFPQGKSEHEYDFYGASLNRSIIRPHHPKICPKCLAEVGYCFRIWDCALVTVCPTHECLLLDRCPRCRRQIRAIRKSVSICVCGYDWREIEPTRISVGEVSVSRRVYELCDKPLNERWRDESKNPLKTLTLGDFILVITLIARCKRQISRATGRPSKSINLNNRELHNLYTQAYEVFDDWPDNFFRFLNGRSKRRAKLQPNDGKLDTALKKEFGLLYESIYQELEGSQFDFLRKAFCIVLAERMHSQSAITHETSCASASQESTKYTSLADARRSLKITNARLFELMAAGEIRYAIVSRRTPAFVVNSIDIERIKGEAEDSVTCRDLAKELGTDCETIRNIAKTGSIKPCVRRSTDAFNTLRFGSSAVEKFRRSSLAGPGASQSRPG